MTLNDNGSVCPGYIRLGSLQRTVAAAALILGYLCGAGQVSAQTRPDVAFTPPTMHGLTVDNCAVWGNNCGWGGAHQFCQAQGHPAARSFQLNRPGRTYVIGTNRVCEGAQCVGFAQVVCIQAAGVNPPVTPPTGRVNIAGQWQGGANCPEGSYGGLLGISALAPDGGFTGGFENGNGNLQGRVQGTTIEFVRSFGSQQQRWIATATANRMDPGTIQRPTEGKGSCTFTAARRV